MKSRLAEVFLVRETNTSYRHSRLRPEFEKVVERFATELEDMSKHGQGVTVDDWRDALRAFSHEMEKVEGPDPWGLDPNGASVGGTAK